MSASITVHLNQPVEMPPLFDHAAQNWFSALVRQGSTSVYVTGTPEQLHEFYAELGERIAELPA